MNGKLAPPSVNVERAVEIGTLQMNGFQKSLPKGYYESIEKKVHTMAETKKGISVGPKIVYDTELIYSRVIGLQASTRDVDIKDVLSYELSPIPTALFDESGMCFLYIIITVIRIH